MDPTSVAVEEVMEGHSIAACTREYWTAEGWARRAGRGQLLVTHARMCTHVHMHTHARMHAHTHTLQVAARSPAGSCCTTSRATEDLHRISSHSTFATPVTGSQVCLIHYVKTALPSLTSQSMRAHARTHARTHTHTHTHTHTQRKGEGRKTRLHRSNYRNHCSC